MSAAEDVQSLEKLNKFEKLSGSPPLRVAGQWREKNTQQQQHTQKNKNKTADKMMPSWLKPNCHTENALKCVCVASWYKLA